MGSPKYAQVILEKINEIFGVVGVITQPDKRAGRGKSIQSPPVKVFAQGKKIPFIQPEDLTTKEVHHILSEWDPDVIIVAAFGKILRSHILDLPRFGCVNVHASFLPRWRGASPIQAAILYGDQTSGVTIIKMDEGIDTGDIISQKEINVSESETAKTLTEIMSVIGAELLIESLPRYIKGEVVLKKQSEENVTYAGLIKKQDGILNFHNKAEDLERKIRAYNPWPICFFGRRGNNLKVYEARVLKSHHLEPGQTGIIDKYPCVGTKSFDLQLVVVQMPGKQKINGKVFLNGVRNWIENNPKIVENNNLRKKNEK